MSGSDDGTRPRSVPARGRRRLPPEQRRLQLINAATTLFSSRPLDQVSVDDIAAEAEVSRALFYRYFANPEDIFLAATMTALDGLIDRLTTPSEGTLIEQLRHAVREFVLFAEEHEAAFVALLRNGSVMATSGADALIDRVRRVAVDEILRRCGVTEAAPMTMMTLRSWVATVEVGTLSWLQDRHLTAEELVQWLIDQLVGMIATTSATTPALAEMIGSLDRPG